MSNLEEKLHEVHEKKIVAQKWYTERINQLDAVLVQFFNQIAFLDQGPEQKSDIGSTVTARVNTKKLYWFEIVLSSAIATLGLLQNSVAVIIGAMLIAPLLRPIQGISLGIAKGETRFFLRSTKLLLQSVAVSVLVALLIAYVVPFQYETPEILARTSPNILDLFIAALSAIVALLALRFKELSESVAGVAMAASLMPPLAVIGIEIYLGNLGLAWGATLLFITNILAILIVGIAMFILYGFRPHKDDSHSVVSRGGVLFLLVLILSVPLTNSILSVQRKANYEELSSNLVEQWLLESFPNSELKNLKVEIPSRKELSVLAEIRLPEEVPIFYDALDIVEERLEQELKKSVSISFDIIRTAVISTGEIELELAEEERTN